MRFPVPLATRPPLTALYAVPKPPTAHSPPFGHCQHAMAAADAARGGQRHTRDAELAWPTADGDQLQNLADHLPHRQTQTATALRRPAEDPVPANSTAGNRRKTT